MLATFRKEWQRELEGAQVQRGLCNVSKQLSPSKKVTQESSSLPKGNLKTLQSSPKKDIDSDSGAGNISGVDGGGNDDYAEPGVDNSAHVEKVTPDVETKV